MGDKMKRDPLLFDAATGLGLYQICPDDNVAVAKLIRHVMPEFGASGPGFAIMDPEVDHMAEAYPGGRAQYYVLTDKTGEKILGGGGFAPLVGGAADTCELRKMYFLAEARGLGWGARLFDALLQEAARQGFQSCYLETLVNMKAAQKLYESRGFRRLSAPMGHTGHSGCDRWYEKRLS